MKQFFHQLINAIESAAQPGSMVSTSAATDHLRRVLADLPDAPTPDTYTAGVEALEKRVAAIENAIAELHAALSESPSPKAVQQAVADIGPLTPHAE